MVIKIIFNYKYSYMNKLFYTILASALVVPFFVNAQMSRPTDSHGLSTQANPNSMLIDVINWILTFTASLAVLMIVVSGVMYITSGGEQQRVETAKKILIFSVAGLAIVLLSYVIMYTVSKSLGIV
jgi:formate hydrogenlyase subunit 3/multisubunit Na+/H+ antiporter MnhD subunit